MLKNPDLIELAAKSGCYELLVGLESVNSDSLKSANKRFNKVDEYEELIAMMRRAGIPITASLIIGFDEDSLDQAEQTLHFLQKNKVTRTNLFVLTPFPGSKLFEEMKEAGRIKHYDWSKYTACRLVFESAKFTEDMLLSASNKFYTEFYSYKRMISNSWDTAKHRKEFGSITSEFFNAFMYLYIYRRYCLKTDVWF